MCSHEELSTPQSLVYVLGRKSEHSYYNLIWHWIMAFLLDNPKINQLFIVLRLIPEYFTHVETVQLLIGPAMYRHMLGTFNL